MTNLNRSFRGLLVADQCWGDSWSDAGTGDAHCSTGVTRGSGWRWRRSGGYGGGHPSHGCALVWGLHGASLSPHSTFLPRFLRLPRVVGRCLPGHQLSFWHILPPVSYAELSEECHLLLSAMQPQPPAVKDCKKGVISSKTQKLQTDCILFLVCRERTGNRHFLQQYILCDQQVTGVNNTNVQIEPGPVSQSKLTTVWLSWRCPISPNQTMEILITRMMGLVIDWFSSCQTFWCRLISIHTKQIIITCTMSAAWLPQG